MKPAAKILACMLVSTLALATYAQAEYIFSPPWVVNPNDPQWAGGVTTHQWWDFNHDLTAPFEVNNPFITLTAPIWANASNALPATVNGPRGTPIRVWQHSEPGVGMVDVAVPNSPADNNRKKVIWAQITTDAGEPSISTVPAGAVSVVGIANTYPPSGWYTYAYRIDIPTNPNYEYISFTGLSLGANIAEVAVDTICVPEPTGLAMLAVAAAGFVAWMCCRRRS